MKQATTIRGRKRQITLEIQTIENEIKSFVECVEKQYKENAMLKMTGACYLGERYSLKQYREVKQSMIDDVAVLRSEYSYLVTEQLK